MEYGCMTLVEEVCDARQMPKVKELSHFWHRNHNFG